MTRSLLPLGIFLFASSGYAQTAAEITGRVTDASKAVPSCFPTRRRCWGRASDSYQDIDLSLFREDRITERCKLQFRAEAFNFLNHPTFAIPQAAVTNPQFGQVSGTASTARQVQLGLKVLF